MVTFLETAGEKSSKQGCEFYFKVKQLNQLFGMVFIFSPTYRQCQLLPRYASRGRRVCLENVNRRDSENHLTT